jgi:hypothetical protein
MTVKEFWRPIKGYLNYHVSSIGRVKNNNTNRILKAGKDTNGYYIVVLCKNGKMKTHKVHKLVAIHFLNHKIGIKNQVIDHIDHDRLNNNVGNLRIVTNRENSSHRIGKTNGKYTSIYTGVYWDKQPKRWKAAITINNKKINLGMFKEEKDAANAYINALSSLVIEIGTQLKKV